MLLGALALLALDWSLLRLPGGLPRGLPVLFVSVFLMGHRKAEKGWRG